MSNTNCIFGKNPDKRKSEDEEDGLIELNLDSEEAIRLENCIIYTIFVIFFLFVFIFVIYLIQMKQNLTITGDEITYNF